MGTKRIGLAQTDLLQTIASPVGAYSPQTVFRKLKQLVNEQPIDKFVVGWPLTTAGAEGSATEMASRFIKQLEKEFPGIPVVKVDERYTSTQARQLMIEAGVPKMKRREKERVDRIAAALILQQYLDANN